ncbi:LamB/YcsF family protein [Dyella solisilvae]|uniref:5-oxoprolinase subunit A n=1 Tax=Dyella solisilvae TaxID=1920168 RepID=A0A370K5Q4_9GAMM|nr:5-oxoprolinase subunit PxpA [Dyella solisilvae]RDI97982.1 LamB/YcsF family protein [Dyella solisilvae]
MTAAKTIDINCDLGESFGPWRMGDDDALLAVVSSANIACGFHAGDPDIMQRTVALAVAHGVAIGAHVSLPDLQGFGRREMAVTAAEAYALTLYQVGALHAFARAAGARLRHVKPHGALYNMAARDHTLAAAIARAVRDFDPSLWLFGLAGSALLDAGREAGLQVASEAFADRGYREDGSLQPRREPGALITENDLAIAQAMAMAREGKVRAVDGSIVELQADTLCVHGDGPHAVAFARNLRAALLAADIVVAAPGADA